MDEQQERVAKQLHIVGQQLGWSSGKPWEEISERRRQAWYEMAHAAIRIVKQELELS